MPDTSPSGAGPATPEETLGALFAKASRDLSGLLHGEIELAKAEIRQDVASGAKGGAMFGAAGFIAVISLVLLSIAAAYGLVAAGLHPAVAFLVVAGAYLLIAGLLALLGKKAISKVGPPAPRTIKTSKETAAFLKNPRSENAPTPAKS